jgi:predicted nucleotidyltransferase
MDDLKKILPELKAALERRYGERLVKLILFGSHARGEATEDSDIDVLAVLKDMESSYREIVATGDIVTELGLEYDTLIALIPIEAERFDAETTPFIANVKSEGVPV